MWDDQQRKLVVRVARNLRPETMARLSVALGEGIAGQVAVSGEPVVVEDSRTHAYGTMRDLMESEGIRASMHIPIEIGDPVQGVFTVDYTRPWAFDREDQRLFLALAQRAALAIRNARLHEQAQQVAMLEERQRLARELHDSVTQSLYSLTFLTAAGRELARVGEMERAEHHLARIEETIQQALKEMRLLVHELRPPVLKREGLMGALHQRLDAIERRAGVRAHLIAEAAVELPLGVEKELYSIAQEALNNALKHAAATSVTIYLRAEGERVELEIVDNGRGFDLHVVSDQGGLGLSTMRERAQHLGGSLEILSRPGEGTRVRVVISIQ
jgi:signal transduction histidine kinase